MKSHKTCWTDRAKIIGDFINIESFVRASKDTIRRQAEFKIVQSKVSNVLDVGCNTGVMGYALMQSGYAGTYLGVDSNPKALKIGKKLVVNDRVDFFNGDIEEGLAFEDQLFDLVHSKDVIEHLPYYIKALTEMMRLSRKYVMLSLFILLGKKDKITQHKDGYFLNQYSHDKLHSFMLDNGFKSVNSFRRGNNTLIMFERVNDEI